MAYVLRFVQRFRPADERAFMALERQFARLERRKRGLPRGRRSRPYAGREPANTLVWEAEFPTLAAAQDAVARLAADRDHDRLLKRQLPLFQEWWTEIHEVLDFEGGDA
jgi:hypothetical protein